MLRQYSRNQSVRSIAALIVLPITLFSIGWVGTERIWFLRLFRGKSMSRGEGWSYTWSFLGRYLVLGLLLGVVAGPFFIYFIVRVVQSALRGPSTYVFGQSPLSQLMGSLLVPFLIFLVLSLIVDFALTFVTPALAFTTRRVSTALRLGLGMIKEQWPRSAWFVVFPPLVVTVLARAIPLNVLGFWIHLISIALSTLLNLWFKGATAAFYLRFHHATYDGAVHSHS